MSRTAVAAEPEPGGCGGVLRGRERLRAAMAGTGASLRIAEPAG